jgi:hypothetical protein
VILLVKLISYSDNYSESVYLQLKHLCPVPTPQVA